MKIKKAAKAGRLDTSDILVELEPIETDEIELDIESSVKRLFGERIKEVVLETLNQFDLSGVRCKVIDDGALDYVIRARVEAAIKRAMED